MKLNRAERWLVNNPLQVIKQRIEIRLLRGMMSPGKKSLRQGSVILEVGCGRGAGAKLLLEAFQPSLLCALDLDIQMVQLARGYLSPVQGEGLSLYVGNVSRLPFKDGSLDAVFGFGVLHHTIDWRGALAEFGRILKTGGLYFMEEYYPTVYLNFIVRHLFLHPLEDRFFSDDLKEALKEVKLPIKDAIEIKKLGILGVAVKED
jgi:ubiquinone/menaquinone biosynthesis C-methylase UbiE